MYFKLHPSVEQTILGEPEHKLRINTTGLLKVTLGFIPAYVNLQKRVYDQHETDCKQLEPARLRSSGSPGEQSSSKNLVEETKQDSEEVSQQPKPTQQSSDLEIPPEGSCGQESVPISSKEDLVSYGLVPLNRIITPKTSNRGNLTPIKSSWYGPHGQPFQTIASQLQQCSLAHSQTDRSSPTPSQHKDQPEDKMDSIELARKAVASQSEEQVQQISTQSLPEVEWSDISEYSTDESWTDSDTNVGTSGVSNYDSAYSSSYNPDTDTDKDSSGVSSPGLVYSSDTATDISSGFSNSVAYSSDSTCSSADSESDWSSDYSEWRKDPTSKDLTWMEQFSRAVFSALSD